jgi:hypothetical protein
MCKINIKLWVIHNLKKFSALFFSKLTSGVRKEFKVKIWPGLPTYRMGFCCFLYQAAVLKPGADGALTKKKTVVSPFEYRYLGPWPVR